MLNILKKRLKKQIGIFFEDEYTERIFPNNGDPEWEVLIENEETETDLLLKIARKQYAEQEARKKREAAEALKHAHEEL